MPIYEYECGKCGVFETSQRISEAPLTKCPTCRRKVRRLISSTSFQLKGSGWYVTDYARNAGDKKGAKDGDAKADSKGESSSSSESTPEAKPKPESKSKKADTKSGTSTAATTGS
jgi:putative FmdB family regulatory protein